MYREAKINHLDSEGSKYPIYARDVTYREAGTKRTQSPNIRSFSKPKKGKLKVGSRSANAPMQNSKLYLLLFIYLTILKYLRLVLTKKMKNIKGQPCSSLGKKGLYIQLCGDSFLLYIQRKILIKKCFIHQKRLRAASVYSHCTSQTPKTRIRTSWHLSL